MESFAFGIFKMWRNVPIKFLFIIWVVNLLLYECDNEEFVCRLDALCMYMKFAFG